jgi:hypothetical protein
VVPRWRSGSLAFGWIRRAAHAPVSDITLRDFVFDGVTQPSNVKHTRSVELTNVLVNGRRVQEL